MPELAVDVGANNIVDLLGLVVCKNVVDMVAGPYLGDGTLMSGALKLGVGMVAHGHGGRIGNMVSGGAMLAGGDDIVQSLIGGTLGNIGNKPVQEW